MKWLDKYEKAQNSKELTDIPSQARDNTNIQPIIKPNIDLSRARSMEQVEYDNAMARAAEWAGTAKPTENQPLYSKLWDIGVNPMSALESLTQTGRIPDNLGAAIQSGNVARNPLDIATDVVNPVATTDYVSQLPTAIAEGDMLGIADRALSIIPGIKAAKGLLGLARTGRRGVSTLSRASRTTKSSRLVPEGGFTDIADAEALMPLVGKDPNLSIDEILKAGGSRYTMKDLSKISSDGSTKGQLKAMNELLLAYQKHTNNFEGLINDFTLIRPDKYDANTVINRSKISREDAIKVAKTKEDRELIEALTDAEFEDTVIKPGGQVVKYDDNLSFNKGDLIDKWGFYEQGPIQSYVDEFNKNLPRLNEIITQNNKSGTPYEVLKLTSDGGLFFKSDLGISNFNLGISPGKFTGQVSPNVNTQYFKDVPGLSMRYTGKSVFADQRPRKGSGVYKSLNEYLKEYDLGRVKAGFNSQTIHSKSLWENYVKTGRAEGFYNEPGVVHAIMKQQGGMIPKAQRGMSFAAMNQARKDEIDQLYAQADEEAKNKFDEYNKTMESAYPPQVAPIKIQDKRKTLATSGQPIRPTKDLVGGTYDPSWLNEVMLAAKADNLSKEDMWNLAAMDFQETKWGKLAPFPGQVIGDFGAVDASDNFVQAYRQKMDLAKKKGVTDPATMLQFYNGMGKIFPDTEEGYHGFKMKKIYGVPVPKEGLDLSKNPLYGKQILDIRDNVLKKNPDMVKFIDSVYNAPPNKHAGVILRREEHPEVTYWNEVRDKEDAITEKYFGSHDNYMDWVQSMEPNMPVFTDPNIGGAFQQGGVVKDNMGYWNPNNRGKVVEINSNNITMKGVNQPLLGVSDTGDSKMMFPGRDYKFKGNKVREYPMAQGGREYTFDEIPTQDNKKIVIDNYSMFYDYMVEGNKVYSKSKKGQKWKDISDNKKAQKNLLTFLDKNNYWAGYNSGERDIFLGKPPAQPYQPETGAPLAYNPEPEPFVPSKEQPWDINKLFQQTAPAPLTQEQKKDIEKDVMANMSTSMKEQIAPEGDPDKGIFSGVMKTIKAGKKKRAELLYETMGEYMDKLAESSVGQTFKDADDIPELLEIVSNGLRRKYALSTGDTDDVEVQADVPVEDKTPKTASEYYGTPDKGRVYATMDAPKTDGRIYKQQTLPTSKISFGARNRGDLTEFETDGMEITTFNPFVAKAFPPNQTVIALDPEGNVHAGVAGDFAGKEQEGWRFSQTFRNNIIDFPERNGKAMYKPSVKNPGFQQPLIDVANEDGTQSRGSMNLLIKGSNDKFYGSVQGGRVLLQDPETKELHLVAGNLEHIKKEFRRLKKNHPYLTAYTLDNGTYSRGLAYKDKKMTAKRLAAYDRENAGGGGNALYIKNYRQPVSQFNEEIVDNMPNVRTEKDESYKKGHALKNEVKKIILHHTAYENEATNSKEVRNQFMTPGKASAHVVIEEDGSRTIYASPEQVTFHAGQSEWEGRKDVNDFGIGVEFQGNTVKKPLTKAQIESFIEYYKPIAEKYGLSLKDILTHEMISPGRKPDVKVQEYQKIMNAMRAHNLK